MRVGGEQEESFTRATAVTEVLSRHNVYRRGAETGIERTCTSDAL